MDHLTACYKSRMRLFRDRPDVLVAGRWCWCPPDAVPIPYFHRFGSMHFDYDGFELGADQVGEVEVIPGYTSGVANARYTGQRWCGAKDVWTDGADFDAQGTPTADPDGVPICCQEEPRRGGAAVEGAAEFAVVAAPDLLWWPAGIEGVGVGAAIATWPDASGNGHDGAQAVPGLRPIRRVGPAGFAAAEFTFEHSLNFPALAAWPVMTAFVVCTPLSPTPNLARVTFIIAGPVFPLRGLNGYPNGPIFMTTVDTVIAVPAPVFNEVEVMSYRRTADEVRVYRNETLAHTESLDPTGEQVFEGCFSTEAIVVGAGLVLLSQVIIYARNLTDAEYAVVRGQLIERYQVNL